jgi:L-alanine-DL-glutamate epimerase-like enolase superfamily enzyme
MKIKSIDIALCPLALGREFKIGTVAFSTRDYVVIRISTDEGCDGYGIAYRSGTQLADSLAAMAPALVGQDPLMRRQILQSLEDSSVPGRAALMRAWSLFDIALWDIGAKVAGLPLYRMLGGLRKEIPVFAAAGFAYHDRGTESVIDEVAALVEAGARKIKIMIGGRNPAGDTHYVTRVAESIRGKAELVLECHWAWRALLPALDMCRRIDDLGLAFIEDPFIPQQWRLTGELRSRLKTPIGAGENILDIYGFVDVVRSVDILRVDSTTSGGITGALAAFDVATAAGRAVLPHIFPYIHGQLACVHPAIFAIEYIPAATGADPVNKLLSEPVAFPKGSYSPSEAPGVGAAIDWKSVVANAVGTKTLA